jgi:hypothetical protein
MFTGKELETVKKAMKFIDIAFLDGKWFGWQLNNDSSIEITRELVNESIELEKENECLFVGYLGNDLGQTYYWIFVSETGNRFGLSDRYERGIAGDFLMVSRELVKLREYAQSKHNDVLLYSMMA